MNSPYPRRSDQFAADEALAASSSSARAAAARVEDLDSKIRAAEVALIARDERVHRDATEIARRLHLTGPRGGRASSYASGLTLGGGAAALARTLFSSSGSRRGGIGRAVRSMFSGRPRPRSAASSPATGAGPTAGAGAGAAAVTGMMRMLGARTPRWAPLLAFAWPLVPHSVRSRVSAGAATTILAVALPLLAHGAKASTEETPRSDGARRRRPAPAPRVDLRRFSGRWYEIARMSRTFERGGDRDVVSEYRFDGDVLRIRNLCRKRNGSVRKQSGIARVVRGGNGARLKASFASPWLRWLPGSWSPVWILRVDPAYRTALVGTPDRKSLWLISRRPWMDDADYTRLVDYARDQGFDVSNLVQTPQKG